MADEVCPPLGTGSVDFGAVHKAALKGQNLEEAIAKATTGGPAAREEDAPVAVPEPAPVAPPAAPAPIVAPAGSL